MNAPALNIKGTMAMLKNVAACMIAMETLRSRGAGRPGFGVFFGHPGYGKTNAAIYVQNKTRAALIEVGDSWTKRTVVSSILAEAGVEPRGTIADMTKQIIEFLGDERRPLIIDEADKLVDKGFIELIREIHDKADCPVLLIGEERLPAKLERIERVADRVLGGCWVAAQPCDHADTRALAELYYPALKLADDLIEQIRLKARGRARRIVDNLHMMQEWARNSGATTLDAKSYDGGYYTGEAPRPRAG